MKLNDSSFLIIHEFKYLLLLEQACLEPVFWLSDRHISGILKCLSSTRALKQELQKLLSLKNSIEGCSWNFALRETLKGDFDRNFFDSTYVVFVILTIQHV